MPQYRKKPVVIEAVRMTKDVRTDMTKWPVWLHSAWNQLKGTIGSVYRLEHACPDGPLAIVTLEGPVTCQIGDWIIRGVKGELYPCKHDIFQATYEPVDDKPRGCC